jgi:Protein of unknown function (DUF2490)
MRALFAFIGFALATGSYAQYQDGNLWTAAALNADLTKQFSVTYNTEVRLFKNATSLDSYINELSFAYKPIKSLTTAIDYRYSRKNQEGYYEGVHRFGAEVSYDQKLETLGLRLKARVRYQLPFNYLGVINDAIYPDNRNVMRFKLSAKYTPVNLKKIMPFASYEFYKAISPKNIYNPIDSYRITFGVSLNLPKRHSVDLYYMLEKEFRSTPNLNHIYGIQYNYDLFKDPVFGKK